MRMYTPREENSAREYHLRLVTICLGLRVLVTGVRGELPAAFSFSF